MEDSRPSEPMAPLPSKELLIPMEAFETLNGVYKSQQKEERMKKVAVVSQKGGVGKTTTAVSLAAALAEAGWRVLIVDLDAQGTASDWLGLTVEGEGRRLLETLTSGGNLEDLVAPSATAGVDGIAAGFELMGFERATAGDVGTEFLLKNAVKNLPQRWDLVLFDCPRSLERIGVNALAAADHALVPVELNFPSLKPLAHLVQLVEQVKARLNPQLEVLGVLGCLMDGRKNHPKDVFELLRKHFGALVFESTIRDSVRFSEASAKSLPITSYDPHGIGSADYRAFAAEFAERLGVRLVQKAVVNG
ncbi:MAG: ParA family protein [Myxococcota bacterium]